jgi:GntR family transcriptional repressor for pyruvate dehydrogenase complex
VADNDHGAPVVQTRRLPQRRRTEKISEIIARDIIRDMRGRTPMTMLPPEAAMLEKYQVGRASLREALRILEVQGLIIIRVGPGGGPMVAPVDSRDFARMSTLYLHMLDATYGEVLEGRLIMEPVMARLAAERQDGKAMSQLEGFLVLPEPEDEAEYLLQSGQFHKILSGLSGNRVLDLVGQALDDIFVDRIEGMIFPPEARAGILRDHRAIARAIINGNATRAEKLMQVHTKEFLTSSIKRHPGLIDEIVHWR